MIATSTRAARTPEGKLRQRIHSLVRENGFTEDEYRDRLEKLTGYRYARLCKLAQLEFVVEVFEQFRTEAALVVRPADDFSDEAALAVLF